MNNRAMLANPKYTEILQSFASLDWALSGYRVTYERDLSSALREARGAGAGRVPQGRRDADAS